SWSASSSNRATASPSVIERWAKAGYGSIPRARSSTSLRRRCQTSSSSWSGGSIVGHASLGSDVTAWWLGCAPPAGAAGLVDGADLETKNPGRYLDFDVIADALAEEGAADWRLVRDSPVPGIDFGRADDHVLFFLALVVDHRDVGAEPHRVVELMVGVDRHG